MEASGHRSAGACLDALEGSLQRMVHGNGYSAGVTDALGHLKELRSALATGQDIYRAALADIVAPIGDFRDGNGIAAVEAMLAAMKRHSATIALVSKWRP